VLPLPAVCAGHAVYLHIALAIMVLLWPVDQEGARFLCLPHVLLLSTLAAAVAQRGIDPRRAARGPHRAGCGGQGDRGLRPLSCRGNYTVGIIVFVILVVINSS